MELKSAISTISMGAIGYGWAKIMEANPRQMALVLMVSEVARQMFLYFNEDLDWNIPNLYSMAIPISLSIAYLNHSGFNKNLGKIALVASSIGFIGALYDELFKNSSFRVSFRF